MSHEPAPAAQPDAFELAARAWFDGKWPDGARESSQRRLYLAELLRARFGPAIATLEMIARHPCWASWPTDKLKPDYHCGECAACVAKEAVDDWLRAPAAKEAPREA